MNRPVKDPILARAGAAAPANARRAFTLIELMVAVAILAILIVIFSGVLSQAQGVVNTSNDDIRTDRDMLAVDDVLHSDLTNITKKGFLKIDRDYLERKKKEVLGGRRQQQ